MAKPLCPFGAEERGKMKSGKRHTTLNRVLVVGSSELAERLREAMAIPFTPSLVDFEKLSRDSGESMSFEIQGCADVEDASWELDRGMENDTPFAVVVLRTISAAIANALWDRDPALQIVSVVAPGATRRLGEFAFPDSAVLLRGPVDLRELSHAVCVLARKWDLQRRTREALADLKGVTTRTAEDLKNAERRIAERTAERDRVGVDLALSQKLESVGRLAAGIAHEISTPIQYIGDNLTFLQDAFERVGPIVTGFQELLQESRDGGISKETRARMESLAKASNFDRLLKQMPPATEHALEGVARIATTIRAIREFAHSAPSIKSSVDLNRALQTTITVTRNEWKYVAEIETDLDCDVPPIPGYADELNQVFLNIIVNAAHAIEEAAGATTDHRGKIRIQTRLAGDHAEIRFIDNGSGIPEEVRSKIFDPFFTTKEIGKGSGQGLALAYGVVVNKHAGAINVESEAGKGTTFTVVLPLIDLPRTGDSSL